MAVRVPINGDTLRWARLLSRFTEVELGRAAGVNPARVAEFESGESEPTYRQMTLIARKLDRPLAFFLAPVPVEVDVPQTADFRGRAEQSIPGELAREIKRAEAHRSAMLDLDGRPENEVHLGEIAWDTVADSARELREALGLNDDFRPPESQTNAVLNFWRGLLEHHGFMVFQTTGVDLAVFRGLSVHHDVLPIILVNGADSANGKVFTLFHEVAHLANRTSGLCVLNEAVNEEAVCNAFAANVLMPEQPVHAFLGSVDPEERAMALAARFRVSVLAAAVRLRTLGYLTDDELATHRLESDGEWARAREMQRQRDGFVPPWRLRYRDLGSNYIGAVARAIEQDRVDWVDATYLLNARLPMVQRMFEEYYRTGGAQ